MQNNPPAKRVLLVDDDPIVLRLYQQGLARLGFEVATATDGVSALKSLKECRPDVLVLDLMMPRLSGAEVLKFMMGDKQFEALPVIVLSNAYMDSLANQAADLGVHTALLKMKCTPASLASAINEVLAGRALRQSSDHLLAASTQPVPAKPVAARPPPQQIVEAKPEPPSPPSTPSTPPHQPPPADNVTQRAREELLNNVQPISLSLQRLLQAFHIAHTEKDRELRLQDFHRKVHFVAAMAAMAEHHALAQMASALEALVFAMLERVRELDLSVERTAAMAIKFIGELLKRSGDPQTPGWAQNKSALIVDDDRLSNRLVISALRNTQLKACGAEDAATALRLLREKVYDLVLLDIEMPQMDGLELCKRLRALPGYERIPVIYVTLHSDFETRAKSLLSGGNDLIAKPILPAELAVKVVMHLLKGEL